METQTNNHSTEEGSVVFEIPTKDHNNGSSNWTQIVGSGDGDTPPQYERIWINLNISPQIIRPDSPNMFAEREED